MYFVRLLPGCCLAEQRLPSHPYLARASLKLRWYQGTFQKVSSCLPSLVGSACPSWPLLMGNLAWPGLGSSGEGTCEAQEGDTSGDGQAVVSARPGVLRASASSQPCGKHLLFPNWWVQWQSQRKGTESQRWQTNSHTDCPTKQQQTPDPDMPGTYLSSFFKCMWLSVSGREGAEILPIAKSGSNARSSG